VPTTEQAIDGRKVPLVLEWRSEMRSRLPLPGRQRVRTSYLSFYDTAGEDLASQSNAYELHYLRAADSLILLLDPFMLPETRQRLRLPRSAITSTEETRAVLARITESLRASEHMRKSMIDIPVAVAFVKMDAFYDRLGEDHPLRQRPDMTRGYDEQLGESTHEQVAALLKEYGGADIDQHLHNNYDDYRYFFVSALGAQPDYDNATVNARGVQPYRVEEPLLWLLQRKDVLPRSHS
jgi:Double-GTPase 2